MLLSSRERGMKTADRRFRRLRIEPLEDRRMLTTMADVVFLVDESGSAGSVIHSWLDSMIEESDSRLRTTNDIDVRYGVVGYGQHYPAGYPGGLEGQLRHAHSQVVDTNAGKSVFDRLWSENDHLADMSAAIDNIVGDGGNGEDGWDAIDHAIAEYDFRPGAVPVFVLMQYQEGREILNSTLTREGILGAFESKNVILNVMTVGESNKLFDLVPYEITLGDFANLEVFGVDADIAGNGQHPIHAFDTAINTVPTTLPATAADTLQISFDGTNTGASGMVGSGKSVVIGQKISGGIGPSAAAYRAKSVPFQMVDMSSGTTNVTPGTSVTFPVASGFSFFGNAYGAPGAPPPSQIFVNQDGTITFGTANDSGDNIDLSPKNVAGRPDHPMIAALWDDLGLATTGQTGTIRRRSVDIDQDSMLDLVIQWTNYRYARVTPPGDNSPHDGITFQAVLFASGAIQFNYQDIDSFSAFNDGDETYTLTGGISATVGIWNGTADPVVLPGGKFVPGPHTFQGALDTLGSIIGESNDSYIRMAWDTGGTVWDSAFMSSFSPISEGGIAYHDAFIESIVNQIKETAAAGKVARADDVLFAYNFGGGDIPAEGFFANQASVSGTYGTTILSTGETIYTASNSIPEVGNPATKVSQVFQTALAAASAFPPNQNNPADLNISFSPTQFPTLTDGRYIVELFFSELSLLLTRSFDVIVEGETLLNNYNIYNDQRKIVEFVGDPVVELDAVQAQRFVGIVKRFAVDVSGTGDTAGLQIRLHGEGSRPLINAVRILRADPPRIENIVVKGSEWANGVDYSYAEAVAAGDQLRPIYLEGADRIEVHFDGPVDVANSELAIIGNNDSVVMSTGGPNPTITFENYNSTSHVATWTLASPLDLGKYALEVNGIKGSGGLGLDGHWTNYGGPVADSHTLDNFEDDKALRLLSGNGNAGTIFEFYFSVLPGDYNQDGVVTSADADTETVKDGDGNGVIESGEGEDDKELAQMNLSTQLPLRKNWGDFDDDDMVDVADYNAWVATFGSTTNLAADGNGNGQVDAADYILWRAHIGMFSAWRDGSGGGSVEGMPIVDFGNAPFIWDVIVGGSTSTHVSYAYLAATWNYNPLMTVPVANVDTVSIVFCEDVNVAASHLRVIGLRTADVPTLVEFSYDIGTMTATWRFDDMIQRDHYLISLSDAVTDIEGNRLDGEWTNLASSNMSITSPGYDPLPSGDGNAGGDFNFVITLLAGDVNLDNNVDSSWYDYSIWESYYGQYVTEFTEGDVSGDGFVDEQDLLIIMANNGVNLADLWVLGDLDGDFAVDDADIDLLWGNMGMQNPTQADGDLDGDNDVDFDDLDLAFAQFGLELAVAS